MCGPDDAACHFGCGFFSFENDWLLVHLQNPQRLFVNQYRVQDGHSIPRFQLPAVNRRQDSSFNALQVNSSWCLIRWVFRNSCNSDTMKRRAICRYL